MTITVKKSTPRSSMEWMRSEFIKRKSKNSQYTLRAFARQLDVPPGRISEILSGKRQLTLSLAQKISEQLGYLPSMSIDLFQMLKLERKVSKTKEVTPSKSEYTDLSAEMFEVIADWQYFAILNLIKLKSFREDPQWIGQRLGISSTEVRSAVDKMLRLGVLKKNDKGKLVRVAEKFVTTYEIPSMVLKHSHRQSLEMAIAALEDVPLRLRDITSITCPADINKIPHVKAAIKLFQRRMAKLIASPEATAVYNINVQLIPITKE